MSIAKNSYGEGVQLPLPEVETLSNGLKVAWFLNNKLPVIDMGIIVRAGYRDDLPEKSGTTELLSLVLDRGAKGSSAHNLAYSIEKLGASRSIIADDDHLTVSLHGLAPDASELLQYLEKVIIHPDFPETEVKREQARLVDRWAHLEDYPEALVGLAYHRILTSGTSYGRGSLKSLAEFKNVGRDDLIGFHHTHFIPNNSLLFIVGQVNRVALKKELLKLFGSWEKKEVKHLLKNYTDLRITNKKHEIGIVDRPGLTQAQIRMGFRAPLFQVPEHEAWVVANTVLGGYFKSRLSTQIRDLWGLAYSVSSALSYAKEYSEFTISSTTRNASVGQFIQKAHEVLKEFKKNPPSPEEVDSAKNYLKGGFPLTVETFNGVASRWLFGELYGLGSNYLNDFLSKTEKVSASDVKTAVEKYFDLDQLVIVIAGDSEKILSSLKSANLKSIRKISVSELN